MSSNDLCTGKSIGDWSKVERLVYEIVIHLKNGVVDKPVDKVSKWIGGWAVWYINIRHMK